ncbi:unnamed protein product [Protopolystoma xenopodis]|uniref:Uncharacterized protein n=1 Tax=Protopolystoma xenopodis TaxID=117903 RepID=A0A448XJ58_9PLAT|nr:unnamed protein product [Protopolystoma xenopodis]
MSLLEEKEADAEFEVSRLAGQSSLSAVPKSASAALSCERPTLADSAPVRASPPPEPLRFDLPLDGPAMTTHRPSVDGEPSRPNLPAWRRRPSHVKESTLSADKTTPPARSTSAKSAVSRAAARGPSTPRMVTLSPATRRRETARRELLAQMDARRRTEALRMANQAIVSMELNL